MPKNTNKMLSVLLATTTALTWSNAAFAQLDEIVVTAQKKSENLQDVPIAIQAFDIEALENNRIEGLEDIGTFTPGVYVTQNPADPNGVRIAIRGVGTFDPSIGQDSRVAVYQDGVYLGKTQGLAFDAPDLERVEILKGPQGTLYGRNTTAGAVNIISAKPDYSAKSGRFKAEYGNFDHKKLSAAINIPLAETAAARISGSLLSRDGWVENSGPGTDFGGEKKYGVRGAVAFDVGSNLRIDAAADYNKVEKEPLFYQSVTGFGAGLFAPAISTFDGRQDEVETSFAPERGNLESLGASVTATWDLDENSDLKLIGAYRKMDSSRFVTLIPTANPAIINATTNGFNQALGALPFAFAAAGQSLRSDFSDQFNAMRDPDRGLFLSPPGGGKNVDGHNQYSFEATYNGQFADGSLEYTGGLFYYNEETGTGGLAPNTTNANDYLFVLGQFDPRLLAPNINAFLDTVDLAPQFPGIQSLPPANRGPIPAVGVLLGQLGQGNFGAFPLIQQLVGNNTTCQQTGSTPTPANNFCIPTLSVGLSSARQTASNTLQIDTEALAIYGQATWHLTDDFRLTGGLRYSKETKDGVSQVASPFFGDNIDLLGNVIEPLISTYDDDVLDPALTLEYDLNDDVMLYASYKQAYRAGGFNSSASGLRIPGQTFSRDFNFDREDLTAYEAGFKGDFGDRFRFNAAGFLYDFKNKQVTFALNPIIATERAIVNTDDELYGFEVDGQFALSEALSLYGSYSYIDGTAGDTVNPNNPADIRNFNELQGTPKNSWLIAANYNQNYGNYDLFGNLTYSHKDSILSIPESNIRIPSIDLMSGRIGVNFDRISFALWGTNLLDEKYQIDSLPFDTFAYRTEVYGQPRSYGVTAGYTF